MKQVDDLARNKKNLWIGATLALSMLLASLGTSIANIALPTLSAAFSASFSLTQGVVVAYLGALTVFTIIVGRLGDVFGLKRMHLLGLGLFSVASLLCGLATNLWLLIAARTIQGIGAAFLMTLSMALMRETAHAERMGRAMGLLGTMSALGTTLGPALAGMLIPIFGWRSIFLIQVPVSMLTLILAFISLPRTTGKSYKPAMMLRTVLAGSLARNLIVNLLVAALMMSTLVIGPFYLVIGIGLKEALVGLVMSVGPAISILSGIPAGRTVDAHGVQRILAIGMAMLATGALLLAILPDMLGITGYIFAIILLTPGYQLFQAANNTAAFNDIPKQQRGMASGLLSLSRNIGLIIGASVMGTVFAFGVGTDDFVHAPPSAIKDGMQFTFLLAAGMMVIAIGIVFWKSYEWRARQDSNLRP